MKDVILKLLIQIIQQILQDLLDDMKINGSAKISAALNDLNNSRAGQIRNATPNP